MIEQLPQTMPETGAGEDKVFADFRDLLATRSTDLGGDTVLAHMDPPTPAVAADLVGLNAHYNQNLLHPDLSPFATMAEQHVINWLLPYFGMQDGHFCAGSTLANLTALWCARENGAKQVVASEDAHISVPKSAHILGMDYIPVAVDALGKLRKDRLPNLKKTCLVLTAGTTGRGAVDDLFFSKSLWTHVDAAWAGPLRLTKHADILNGIELADSVAISAHKWFYQPKDSGIILFKDPTAREKISFGGSYLSTPNVGVQGSRGAAAIPLVATLMAWGRSGLASRIEKNMADAKTLAQFLANHPSIELKQMPETGVINWRPHHADVEHILQALSATSSRTKIGKDVWVRQVAANPSANVELVIAKIQSCLKT